MVAHRNAAKKIARPVFFPGGRFDEKKLYRMPETCPRHPMKNYVIEQLV